MKYSKELIDEICRNIENGVLNKDAAQLSGIGESTFYDWLKEFNADGTKNDNYRIEFAESIKKAEATRKRNFIASIVKASNKNWQASAWYLERVYPEEFGRKERSMDIKGDGNITVTIKDYE